VIGPSRRATLTNCAHLRHPADHRQRTVPLDRADFVDITGQPRRLRPFAINDGEEVWVLPAA